MLVVGQSSKYLVSMTWPNPILLYLSVSSFPTPVALSRISTSFVGGRLGPGPNGLTPIFKQVITESSSPRCFFSSSRYQPKCDEDPLIHAGYVRTLLGRRSDAGIR